MTWAASFERVGTEASETLARLHRDAFAGLVGRYWSAGDFAEILKEINAIGLLARVTEADRETGVVAGYAVFRCVADETELLSIGVLDAWRGQGIGRRLLIEGARLAEHAGARRLLLDVAETNRAALQFYAGLGFVEDGRRPAYYRVDATEKHVTSVPVAAILMSARLPLN